MSNAATATASTPTSDRAGPSWRRRRRSGERPGGRIRPRAKRWTSSIFRRRGCGPCGQPLSEVATRRRRRQGCPRGCGQARGPWPRLDAAPPVHRPGTVHSPRPATVAAGRLGLPVSPARLLGEHACRCHGGRFLGGYMYSSENRPGRLVRTLGREARRVARGAWRVGRGGSRRVMSLRGGLDRLIHGDASDPSGRQEGRKPGDPFSRVSLRAPASPSLRSATWTGHSSA